MEELYKEIIKIIESKRVLLNEPMSNHTTFKIGGKADLYIKVQTVEELKSIVAICNYTNTPITVIGNGSNLLVKDRWNTRSYSKTRF